MKMPDIALRPSMKFFQGQNGHGEYGVVYLAKHLDAHYALKVVRRADKADAARARSLGGGR